MAGGPFRFHANDDGVLIAIGVDANHFLRIAGGFSLMPETLTAPAEKNRFFQLLRFLQAFAAHIRNSEHFSRCCILHNGRDQPV